MIVLFQIKEKIGVNLSTATLLQTASFRESCTSTDSVRNGEETAILMHERPRYIYKWNYPEFDGEGSKMVRTQPTTPTETEGWTDGIAKPGDADPSSSGLGSHVESSGDETDDSVTDLEGLLDQFENPELFPIRNLLNMC
jgi:hypothetical protein